MLFAVLEMVRGWLMPFPFWMRDLGRRGEYLVRRSYHRKGYHCLDQNWIHGKGEIDLVMANYRRLVFVEVKTRTAREDRELGSLIRKRQVKRLFRLAHVYLWQWPEAKISWQFQLVVVLMLPKRQFRTITSEIQDPLVSTM